MCEREIVLENTYTRIRTHKGWKREKRKQSRYASLLSVTRTYARTYAPVKTIHFKFPLSINLQNYFFSLCRILRLWNLVPNRRDAKITPILFSNFWVITILYLFSTSLAQRKKETLFCIFLYVNGYWVFPYELPARKDKSRIRNFVWSVRWIPIRLLRLKSDSDRQNYVSCAMQFVI